MGSLAYRLRIHDPLLGSEAAFRAGTGADLLLVTSLPDGPAPYIAAPPDGEGQAVDERTGSVTTGSYRIRVIDAVAPLTQAETVLLESWDYADATTRDAAWSVTVNTTANGNSAASAVRSGGVAGVPLHLAVTPGVGLGDGSGRYYIVRTLDGVTPALEPDVTYTLRASVTLSRDPAPFPAGVSVGGRTSAGDDITPGSLEQPAGETTYILSASVRPKSDGTLDLQIGHFDLEALEGPITITVDWIALTQPASGTGRVVTSILADPSGRLQVNSAAANIEETTDGGSSWAVLVAGYVNGVVLDTGITYEFTIGESQRVLQRLRVFEVAEPGFDRVSCILGGPIVEDFGPMRDDGRPRWTVIEVTATHVTLQWTGGQIHAGIHETDGEITDGNRQYLNDLAAPYLGYLGQDGQIRQGTDPLLVFRDLPFVGLTARLLDIATGPGVISNPPTGMLADEVEFTPVSGPYDTGLAPVTDLLHEDPRSVMLRWPVGRPLKSDGVSQWPSQPALGDRFKMIVYPTVISEQNPLHWTGHVVDFATKLLARRGQEYDAASAAAVKDAIGPAGMVEYRITGSMTLAQALQDLAFGPFGFAIRQNRDGKREFFRTRGALPAPVATITINDLRAPGPVIWETEEAKAVTKVRLEVLSFTILPDRDANEAIDYLRAVESSVEAVPDPSLYEVSGDYSLTYAIPGRLRGQDPLLFVRDIGADLFPHMARGPQRTELAILRGVTDAQVGDVVVLSVNFMPTAEG